MDKQLTYEELLQQLRSILIDVIGVDDSYIFNETDTFESIEERVYFDSMDKEEVVAKLEDYLDANFSDEFVKEIMSELTLKEICETIINL